MDSPLGVAFTPALLWSAQIWFDRALGWGLEFDGAIAAEGIS